MLSVPILKMHTLQYFSNVVTSFSIVRADLRQSLFREERSKIKPRISNKVHVFGKEFITIEPPAKRSTASRSLSSLETFPFSMGLKASKASKHGFLQVPETKALFQWVFGVSRKTRRSEITEMTRQNQIPLNTHSPQRRVDLLLGQVSRCAEDDEDVRRIVVHYALHAEY